MSDDPKVSILTPTYNQAQYIGECIQSVRNQTFPGWEQLILDDGSTDSTRDVIEAFGDSRISYIRMPHRGIEGLGKTYNLGLENSKSEIVAILEGDDFWPPGKLESQLPLFDDSSTLLSWGQGLLVSEAGAMIRSLPKHRRSMRAFDLGKRDAVRRLLWQNFLVPSSGVVVRHSALKRIGGFHQPRGVPFVDAPTWLRLAATMQEDEKFVYLQTPVVYWRIHPAQVSSDYRRMSSSRALFVQEFFDHVRQNAEVMSQIGVAPGRQALAYHWARHFMTMGDWSQSLKSLRTCWRGEFLPLRGRTLLATLSCIMRFDWFQVIPVDL